MGELSARSDVFRTRWGAHAAEPGSPSPSTPPNLTIYTAEPGSPSAEGLNLLASWAATHATGSAVQPLSRG